MKKVILLLAMLVFCLPSFAVEVDVVTQESKIQNQINEIAFKLLNGSRIDKIIPTYYEPSKKGVNAYADLRKTAHIQKGIMRFLKTDDELAAVIAHEIAHAMDLHKGPFSIVPMVLNSKAYEFRADKQGVDLMVNAGYNPVAMIVAYTKVMPQVYIDWVPLKSTHPKTSRRLAAIYEYIYLKYPQYLANNEYKDNVYYQNFLLTSKENRKRFEVKAKDPGKRVRYK